MKPFWRFVAKKRSYITNPCLAWFSLGTFRIGLIQRRQSSEFGGPGELVFTGGTPLIWLISLGITCIEFYEGRIISMCMRLLVRTILERGDLYVTI